MKTVRVKAIDTVQFIKDRLHGCAFDETTTKMAEIEIESVLRAYGEEVRKECAENVFSRVKFYSPDIFNHPERGKHGKTVDACSAKALWTVLPTIAKAIESMDLPGERKEG